MNSHTPQDYHQCDITWGRKSSQATWLMCLAHKAMLIAGFDVGRNFLTDETGKAPKQTGIISVFLCVIQHNLPNQFSEKYCRVL